MFATASGKLKALTELGSLTVRQKIALGGAGALTPIILNLLVVDASRSLREITFIVVVGYVLKVVSLFYLGGMTAALHRQEQDALRVFELGVRGSSAFARRSWDLPTQRVSSTSFAVGSVCPRASTAAWMRPSQ